MNDPITKSQLNTLNDGTNASIISTSEVVPNALELDRDTSVLSPHNLDISEGDENDEDVSEDDEYDNLV